MHPEPLLLPGLGPPVPQILSEDKGAASCTNVVLAAQHPPGRKNMPGSGIRGEGRHENKAWAMQKQPCSLFPLRPQASLRGGCNKSRLFHFPPLLASILSTKNRSPQPADIAGAPAASPHGAHSPTSSTARAAGTSNYSAAASRNPFSNISAAVPTFY